MVYTGKDYYCSFHISFVKHFLAITVLRLLFMIPNKVWGIIKSDCPSVRSSVRLSVRPFVRPFEKKRFFEEVFHLNCTFIWGHLSRTVTQFLFITWDFEQKFT